MTALTIGCNFDESLIDYIVDCNNIARRVFVKELYGSIQMHSKYTARPYFRLPSVSEMKFKRFIKRCISSEIQFDYTLNTVNPGSKRQLASNSKFTDLVKYLVDSGIQNITIANPMLALLIRDCGLDVKLTISTIAHIDTVTQIKIWHEEFNIRKVHINILKNRSIKFLKAASTYCASNNIELCLLANEFCGTGSSLNDNALSMTHCIYRDSCYLCHSTNKLLSDDMLLNGYPMTQCIKSRYTIESWIKTMYIRPEDLCKYKEIGITSFKLTGRTGTTEYLKRIIAAYTSESWEGNLLELWKPLETIRANISELNYCYDNYISNKKLDGFLNFWFENLNHECANEICGKTCRYCNEFAMKNLCHSNIDIA